jgi:hypothetical protein
LSTAGARTRSGGGEQLEEEEEQFAGRGRRTVKKRLKKV